MIRTLIYGGLAAGLVVGGVLIYGEARYQVGQEHKAAEQALAAVALHQILRRHKAASDLRLDKVRNESKRKEVKFHAQIEGLKQSDKTFSAWLEQPIHPVDVGLIDQLRRDVAGGVDRVPP